MGSQEPPEGSRPKDRRALWVGVGLLIITAVVAGLSLRGPGEQVEGQLVRAKRVVRGELTSRVRAQGRVRAKRQARVGSEISGRVVAVYVEEGQTVAVGDPLFALDDEQAKNAVSQLRVSLRSAQAMLKRAELVVAEARRNLERDEVLNKRGALAREQVAATRARLELSEADIETAQASVDRTRLDLVRAQDALSKTAVTAPLAGTVVDVGLEVGQVVAPTTAGFSSSSSSAAGLGGLGASGGLNAEIVIADLRELEAELEVDELDIARVRVGQKVSLEVQGSPQEEIVGRIERSGLFGREAGGAVIFDVLASVDLTPGVDGGTPPLPTEGPPTVSALRPGMSVTAEIEVQTLPDAVLVPMAAVLEAQPGPSGDEAGDRVFVVEEDGPQKVARQRTIVIGPSERDLVSVMSGLKVGDVLVEGPYRALRELKEGDPVQIDGEVDDVRTAAVPTAAGAGP